MNTKIFLLLVALLGAPVLRADREIGFPEGKLTTTLSVGLGSEFPGARASIYPEVLPDGSMAVCFNGDFEFGGSYVCLSLGLPEGNYEAVEMEMARGDYEKIGILWIDETGQSFVIYYDLSKYPTQKLTKVRFTRENGKLHVSYQGAKDGKWHGRLKGIRFQTVSRHARQGVKTPKIYFRSIKLIGQEKAKPRP